MTRIRPLIRNALLASVMMCALVLNVRNADAAPRAEYLVSPSRPDSLASPVVFRTIQTATETGNAELSKSSILPVRITTGINTYIGSRNQIYDLPLIGVFNPSFQLRLDIPIVSAVFDTPDSGRISNTGIGDVLLSATFRTELDKIFESFFTVTAAIPSGNADSGLGLGAYDFTLTHKTIIMLGSYRTTFMAGLTLPPSGSTTVLGRSVDYGAAVSYMAAAESSFSIPDLRYGIKAAGLHAFSSKINSVDQANAVTTLDLIPEVSYNLSNRGSITAGIVIPLLTFYDMPGAANRRDPIINLGVRTSF